VASAPDSPDEFETIERLFKPLTEGAPEAQGLNDDVAVLPARMGFDLVATKDALVEGVHFLETDPLDLVARKLLRVNLSDLAAKGAEPYGYLLAVNWSKRCRWEEREAFAAGLAQDQKQFGIHLFGGDTTTTPGPLTCSLTAFGWVPHGRTVTRGGARSGDLVLVSGVIGDGLLGLAAARGELSELEPARVEALAKRYHLPEPRVGMARLVRENASASADVSDGLIADVGHIAEASGLKALINLEALPLSRAARAWLHKRVDPGQALLDLATGGDDYEIVCCARADRAETMIRAAQDHGDLTVVGHLMEGEGVAVSYMGDPIKFQRAGWRHR
jgi:thiamine-monophosphate kinase